MTKKNIVALGGSNSNKSINKTLAIYAANQIEHSKTIVVDLNDLNLPLYGIDIEQKKGIPDDATRLNALIASADGLVLSLAEHNGSYTAVFKNTIDWLSRIDKQVWKHKPMLLMATSPGGRGGANVLEAAKAYFPRLGGNIVANFSLPSFHDHFLAGKLTNEGLRAALAQNIQLLQDAL